MIQHHLFFFISAYMFVAYMVVGMLYIDNGCKTNKFPKFLLGVSIGTFFGGIFSEILGRIV